MKKSKRDAAYRLEVVPVAEPREWDQGTFGEQVEPFRRELQAHCYRITGSTLEAEDMVQETFLRAWRRRETFEGRASLRAWLYKIATNACLDLLDKRARRGIPKTMQAVSLPHEPIPPDINEPIWLEPYPDNLLAVNELSPEQQLVRREIITLAFIVALHRLPPRQRAILILRDVLEWDTREVAALMEATESSVKSALHRARATLAQQDEILERHPTPNLDAATQKRLEDYVTAWQTADIPLLVQLLTDDATFSMPPIPSWYRGRAAIADLVNNTIFKGEASGRWRLLPTRANRQLAFGLYRLAAGGSGYCAYGIQVLTFTDDQIADIITFRNPALMPYFDLPAAL